MERKNNQQATVIAVSSGKGGVGKTMTTLQLAYYAAKDGKKVTILDGDLGLANCDVMLGLRSSLTIADVIGGHAKFADIILPVSERVELIPAGSGVSSLATLSPVRKKILFDHLAAHSFASDLLLIDTGAGISDSVLNFHMSCHESLVVTTPEPHALTDAYALIKVLHEDTGRRRFFVTVNQARSSEEGERIFLRLQEVCDRFLKVELHFMGAIPADPMLQKFIMRRKMFADELSHTIAGQAWRSLYQNLSGELSRKNYSGNETKLFSTLLWPYEGFLNEGARQAV